MDLRPAQDDLKVPGIDVEDLIELRERRIDIRRGQAGTHRGAGLALVPRGDRRGVRKRRPVRLLNSSAQVRSRSEFAPTGQRTKV